MKKTLLAGLLLWTGLVLENARPDLLPRGCLVFPLATTIALGMRSGTGVILCGAILLIDWVTRPTALPVAPLLLPCATTAWLVKRSGTRGGYAAGSRRPLLPVWLLPALLTALVAVLQPLPDYSLTAPDLPRFLKELGRFAVVALPVSIFLGGGLKLFRELSWHQPESVSL